MNNTAIICKLKNVRQGEVVYYEVVGKDTDQIDMEDAS